VQLVLIKHSAVVVDAAVPPKQWPLNDEGRRLCRPLATALRMHNLDVLVSSTEPKAIETADLVAQRLRIDWHTADDLDEHRRPFAEPTAFEMSMEHFFAQPAQRIFGEESADEVQSRFRAAVDAVLAAEVDRNVGIVAHGTVIGLYAAAIFGIGAGALWQRLQSPSFVVVDTETHTGLRIVDEIE
jgi:broad specificity phosphatase PhoE